MSNRDTFLHVGITYPHRDLSPNARKHWRRHAAAKKAAHLEGMISARDASKRKKLTFPEGEMRVEITIHPPDNRRRDMDNVIASLKAVQDGIASALGVDDHLWQPSYKWGERVKGGEVIFSFPDIEVIR